RNDVSGVKLDIMAVPIICPALAFVLVEDVLSPSRVSKRNGIALSIYSQKHQLINAALQLLPSEILWVEDVFYPWPLVISTHFTRACIELINCKLKHSPYSC